MDNCATHALVMLIMNTLDISDMTPAQVVDKYVEIANAVDARFLEIDRAQRREL